MEGMGVRHMAQSERFYFWRGYYDALRMLPTAEQRDALVLGICAYAFEGEVPDFSGDPMLGIVWQIVRDQVSESVDIGRRMAERGRRSGESRRKRKDANTVPNSVPNSVPNEGKGTEVTSGGHAPSLTAPALAAETREPPEPPAPRDPEEDLRAAHAVLAAMEAIEAEERRARGGDG